MRSRRHNKDGNGIFLVIIIATALGIGIFSVASLVEGEFRLNKRASAYHEAKHTAESLLQMGMAELKTRFDTRTTFPPTELRPSNNPLSITKEFVNIHTREGSQSFVVMPEVLKPTSIGSFNKEPTELIAGQLPDGRWRYIDPRIPGNETDELAGTRVYEQKIEMVSKATVERVPAGNATVYARQTLSVRDAPLFAYAVFYNVPMEIAPGPKMEIFGNIHSNSDIYMSAITGLTVHSRISIAGDLYAGRDPDSGLSDPTGPVQIANGLGGFSGMQKDSSWPSEAAGAFSGGWLDSRETDFRELSMQVWNGNVQTGAHGVLTQNPPGVSDYIEDTDPSTAELESFNSAYPIIQPVLEKSDLSIPSESSDPDGYEKAVARNELEKQKFSYNAGLTITVNSGGGITYSTYERDLSGNVRYGSDGKPKKIDLTPSEPVAVYKPFAESSGTVTSGMHDKRQSMDLDIVELDVGKLRDLLHADDSAGGSDPDAGGDDAMSSNFGNKNKQSPDNWWNGVVYVDFPQEKTSSSRDDDVNPAAQGKALKLVNGEVLPNPKFAKDKGTTFATNQMLYVQGNYNADGDRSTGSPVAPDDSSDFGKRGEEAPAALVADSVTFLSTAWDDKNSLKSMSSRIAEDTEVSAAILTGIVPSGEDGSARYSGGVENFPRFLENWGGKNLRIRGSMVALFESEVGTRGWGYSDVYSPPNRDWGFHNKFAKGEIPPGTPITRRYRGIDFALVNEAEYAETIARIKTYY